MKDLLLIANPGSGRFSGRALQSTQDLFVEAGIRIHVFVTEVPGQATEKAFSGREKYDVVVAMGGDGTTNEVINGLVGSCTPLGILPSGTGNALAQGLGIPRSDITEAAKVILRQKRKRVDLGKLNEKYFVLVAGVGFDAFVAAKIRPELKKYLGIAAYPLTALKEIFGYEPTRMDVRVKGTHYRGTFVLAANSKIYGGPLSFARKAEMDDGLLDFLIFRNMDPVSALRYAWGATRGDLHRLADISYVQAEGGDIESEEPVPIHLDAEPYGTTPARIRICKRCLDLLVP